MTASFVQACGSKKLGECDTSAHVVHHARSGARIHGPTRKRFTFHADANMCLHCQRLGGAAAGTDATNYAFAVDIREALYTSCCDMQCCHCWCFGCWHLRLVDHADSPSGGPPSNLAIVQRSLHGEIRKSWASARLLVALRAFSSATALAAYQHKLALLADRLGCLKPAEAV